MRRCFLLTFNFLPKRSFRCEIIQFISRVFQKLLMSGIFRYGDLIASCLNFPRIPFLEKFSCSESSPWDACWTEIVFTFSDVILALGLLWSSPSEFSDRKFKAFSSIFSDFLISFLIFWVNSFSMFKDTSSICSSVKLFLSTFSRGNCNKVNFSHFDCLRSLFPLKISCWHLIFIYKKCGTIR